MDSDNGLRDRTSKAFRVWWGRWMQTVQNAWQVGCECHRCENVQRFESDRISRREFHDIAEVHFFADLDAGMIFDAEAGAIGVVHPYAVPGIHWEITPESGSGP